jgi:hypothetical protein
MCFAARSVRPHADSTLSASMKRACALPVFGRAFEYDPCGTDTPWPRRVPARDRAVSENTSGSRRLGRA